MLSSVRYDNFTLFFSVFPSCFSLAFREVFNLFDINGGGTIDANELDSALKSVDIQLTRQEIVDVLHVIDEDGNGEIDFEEFLSLMTSTEKYLATLRGKRPELALCVTACSFHCSQPATQANTCMPLSVPFPCIQAMTLPVRRRAQCSLQH